MIININYVIFYLQEIFRSDILVHHGLPICLKRKRRIEEKGYCVVSFIINILVLWTYYLFM